MASSQGMVPRIEHHPGQVDCCVHVQVFLCVLVVCKDVCGDALCRHGHRRPHVFSTNQSHKGMVWSMHPQWRASSTPTLVPSGTLKSHPTNSATVTSPTPGMPLRCPTTWPCSLLRLHAYPHTFLIWRYAAVVKTVPHHKGVVCFARHTLLHVLPLGSYVVMHPALSPPGGTQPDHLQLCTCIHCT